MDKSIYIFNPDHDMALAVNSRYYMTPSHIIKMMVDLSFLPAWYAEGEMDKYIYAENVELVTAFMDGLPVKPEVKPGNIEYILYNKVYPWGWNNTLVDRLCKLKIPLSAMPQEYYINKIREMSSREYAIKLLPNLILNERFCGMSTLLQTVSQIDDFLSLYKKIVLKEPWSGSGRGVRIVVEELSDNEKGWSERVIRTQGAIVAEPFYNKIMDFAMEFSCNKQEVRFVGYSIFDTDNKGAYKGNILATDYMLEERLGLYVDKEDLHRLKEELSKKLYDVYGDIYEGYLGVDMMVCIDTGKKYLIHPCVEVNLRMSMGLVARKFYDKYVECGKEGMYYIEYYRNKNDAVEKNIQLMKEFPLKVTDSKIAEGYMSLTPINVDTLYNIYIIIDK